jgi:hemoglobin
MPDAKMNDIATPEDIDVLIDTFYGQLIQHPEMRPFFDHIDLDHHLPRIKHFWRFVLLNDPGYTTNVFDKHVHMPLQKKHFDIWVQLFCTAVDGLFAGDLANDAKLRARTLGFTFAYKMEQLNTPQ